MKVNHNIPAVLANNRLRVTEKNLSASVQRLSSGYKVNSAKDNPAGFAIAHKMSTQLRGLERAADNAVDGVSAIETAEGALNEIQSMLQRIRQLAVQSANDTYTPDDREAIQVEVDKLQEEIQRLAEDTEFNKKTLLDGSFDTRAYGNTDGVSAALVSDTVEAGNYKFTIDKLATKTTLTGVTLTTDAYGQTADNAKAASFCINDFTVEFSTDMTFDEVYGKIREAAETVDVKVSKNASGELEFVSEYYGSSWDIEISASPATLINSAGTKTKGVDAQITLQKTANEESLFNDTASCSSDGQHVKITDRNGFEMTIKVDEVAHKEITGSDLTVGTKANIDVKGFGYMSLQIGSNENQTIDVRIPEISLENMGIDSLNFMTHESASRGITEVDNALMFVSSVRAKLGAYQNRLDYTISSLEVTEESLTQAYSRIMDTDMAEEMATYSQYNVLQQAGVSVLAQANDLPQTVLQLLQ